MFVAGGGWIGAARGRTVVHGKSRLMRTACRVGRWPDGAHGVGADGLAAGAHCTNRRRCRVPGNQFWRTIVGGRTDRRTGPAQYNCHRVRRRRRRLW